MFTYFLFETRFHRVQPWLAWHSLCGPGLRTQRNPPASLVLHAPPRLVNLFTTMPGELIHTCLGTILKHITLSSSSPLMYKFHLHILYLHTQTSYHPPALTAEQSYYTQTYFYQHPKYSSLLYQCFFLRFLLTCQPSTKQHLKPELSLTFLHPSTWPHKLSKPNTWPLQATDFLPAVPS